MLGIKQQASARVQTEEKKLLHLLPNLLLESEAGQDGQGEDHHRQAVVSQEGDQRPVEGLH